MRGIAAIVIGLWVGTGIAAAQSASVSDDGTSSYRFALVVCDIGWSWRLSDRRFRAQLNDRK